MGSESDIVPGRMWRSRGSPSKDTPRPKHSIKNWPDLKPATAVRETETLTAPQESTAPLISWAMIIIVCTAQYACRCPLQMFEEQIPESARGPNKVTVYLRIFPVALKVRREKNANNT